MNNSKKSIGIIVTVVVMLLTVFGVTYAFVNFTLNGNENSILVTGDIYMNYTETNQINLTDAVPMDKESALKLSDNVFNFTISGKNQSKKDIYYGISIVYGEEQASKTRLKDEDIDVYLTSGEDVLVNANRYKSLNDTRIWAEKIDAGTNSYTKEYSLRLWVDESVIISDTDANKDYTQEVWNNSYASYKVKVDGNLNKMNIPLEIDAKDSYFENGKSYFIVNISNYLNPQVATKTIATADIMKLDITSTNKDVVFTYQDDTGNKVDEESSTLSQTYTFDTNKVIKIQVYVTSKNVEPINADINIKVTKNDNETYEVLKNMSLRGANEYYCQNNGFTKLADCLLVSEQYSKDVESAKLAIKKKGAPTLSKTAPEITYIATAETTGAEVTQRGGYAWAYGDSYTFDINNGTFTLSGNVKTNQSLSDAIQGKWTCGATSDNITNCNTIYHITLMEGNTIKAASSSTYQIANVIGSEVGLYQTTDNDGDTYFYRGDIKNNNVKFAGFYWKIIRVNGDGSIRLIYNGTKPNSNEMNASSVTGIGVAYNKKYSDPAYVGYMYGDNFSTAPIKSKEVYYNGITANTKYYFGTGYTPNDNAGTFKITGADYLGTFTEWNSAGKLAEGYKYTCMSTIADGTCQFLIEIKTFNDATSIQAYYWTYGSTSYEAIREDTASSNAKIELENWYTNTLAKAKEAGETADKYINLGGTFCNDRSLSSQGGNGDGFSIVPTTYYGAYDRNVNKKAASLICPNALDLFSAKGSSGKGNKKLEKPIGLITADEVALAGGLYNTKNERYYLKTGAAYWTMSPVNFSSIASQAREFDIDQDGKFKDDWVPFTTSGLRAVINLKKEVLLAGGNGTMDDPYTVKLAS